jgi:hypothetical protein
MKIAAVPLALLGIGWVVWQGLVVPAKETAAIARLYHMAVQVHVDSDFPARTGDAAAARDVLLAELTGAGLRPADKGWPELNVTVHEYRRASQNAPNGEVVGNVEMTLFGGPAASDVLWSRATLLERRPAAAGIDVGNDVADLADRLLREFGLTPRPPRRTT